MTEKLINRDRQVVWHPFTSLQNPHDPLPVKEGKGIYLFLEDGRRIMDGISSWWVNIHGHCHPHIIKAISDQAARLEQVIFAGFTHDPAVTLAERVLKILPDNQSKVFFSDDGSTSVEVALKMAFQHWHNQGIERKKVIALDGAYHGDTFGSMSVGARGTFSLPFDPYLFKVEFIDFPWPGQEEKTIRQFRELIESGQVAAFIFEPLVQGAGGMRMYSPECLVELIRLAKEYDVICIADEVMTGFGRTGKFFAADYLFRKPDIFCLSKGLTGGSLPLSLTTCSEDILQPFQNEDLRKTFFHGHSFTGNPISCAAANASLDLLTHPSCLGNINRVSGKHIAELDQLKDHPKLSDVRSRGTILAMDLNTDGETSYFNRKRDRIYSFFLEKDILLRPLGNVIYVMPPYIIEDEELDLIYAAIHEYLEED